jgi:hypothetical protein
MIISEYKFLIIGFLIISKKRFLKEVPNNILELGYLIIVTVHKDVLFYKKSAKNLYKI